MALRLRVKHEGAQEPKTSAKSNSGLKVLDSPNKLINLWTAFKAAATSSLPVRHVQLIGCLTDMFSESVPCLK